MKKPLLIFIPVLLIIASYFFWITFWINIKDNILGNARSFFIALALVSIFHFGYWIYIISLRIRKKVATWIVFLSTPLVVVYILAQLLYIMVISGGYRSLDLGPDPFFMDTNITSSYVVPIWRIDYWVADKAFEAKYRDKKIREMQITRRGSLIGHIGTSLQGWTDERILYAFGEPSKIIKVNEELEKWFYNPWTDHPDWEMPVYVQNGVLLKIGD